LEKINRILVATSWLPRR